MAFEAKTLYPLAGLDRAEAPRYAALLKAMQRLSGARFTIAQEYLDGRLTRAAAVEAEQKYELLSLARAEKAIGFTDHYRSYVINYGLGKDMVKARVEAAGLSQKARWQQMASILSQPTIPADLATAR